MAPGATPEAVATELNALASRLPERFGGSANYARLIGQHRAVVRPLEDELLGDVARPLWVLLAAVGIVLLIACANVANLFLVRAEGRQRDLAVRRAIGAGRGQLVRVQMSEAIVVAALAGLLALVLAYFALQGFVSAAPAGIPRLRDVAMSPMTLLFTLGAAMLVGAGVRRASGAARLLLRLHAAARRQPRLDAQASLGARRPRRRPDRARARAAHRLGLLVRSFWALRSVDPGYDTKDLFTFQIAPEGPHLPDGPAYRALQSPVHGSAPGAAGRASPSGWSRTSR